MTRTVTIDPKIFIRPPYWRCPQCNTDNAFGVLMICDNYYIRRCKKCRHDENYPLPKLHKKIVYIDQLAISNMMKALNHKTKAYKKGNIEDIWLTMFEKLDVLCKMQVIVCPDSMYHANESILSPFYESLERMYKLLSSGVTFKDRSYIYRVQIFDHMKYWLSKKTYKPDLDINKVVRSGTNSWQERFIISVSFSNNEEWIDSLREARGNMHKELGKISEEWKKSKENTFEDFFDVESMSFGRTHVQSYMDYYRGLDERLKNLVIGQPNETLEDLLPPPSVILIDDIKDYFIRLGVKEDEGLNTTLEYLLSASLKEIPAIRISSLLYASLARKFANGRKKPPNQGMANDFELISLLFPYCDAMFIDNECRNYLAENPAPKIIEDYNTKVFSQNNIEGFFDYLDRLKNETSGEHMKKVEEVYGAEWLNPYTTIFNG